MAKKILGISGSPVKNSNVERAVKMMMDESGLESEFVKLSAINVRPCMACKGCINDNICKVKDDFQELSKKLIEADAIIIGSYVPYRTLDGFIKAFLERIWSLRHRGFLLKDKSCAIVVGGIIPKSVEAGVQALADELKEYEHMNLLGTITTEGNIPCVYCGSGDSCERSEILQVQKMMNDTSLTSADFPYKDFEDNKEILGEVKNTAKAIAEAVK